MSVAEKRSWVLLGLFVVVSPVWLWLALAEQGPDDGKRFLRYDRPAAMWVAQIATVVAAAVVFLSRRRRGPAEVAEDERDLIIARRALVGAGYASLFSLLGACLIVLVIFKRLRGEEVIPLDVLVAVVALAGVVWLLTYTIVTLVLYRRGG